MYSKKPLEKKQMWQGISPKETEQDVIFNNFVEDFIAHLRSEVLDSSTWFILTAQIKDWFRGKNESDRAYYAKKGIKEDEFFANIADPQKFHQYCERLPNATIRTLMRDFLNFRLEQNFLQRERDEKSYNKHIMKDIYAMMSYALGIKLYFVDREFKTIEYSPSPKPINTASLSPAVKNYLNGGPVPFTKLRHFEEEVGKPEVADKELVFKIEVKGIFKKSENGKSIEVPTNFLTIYWKENGKLQENWFMDVPDEFLESLPQKTSTDKALIELIAAKAGCVNLKEDKNASDMRALFKAQGYLPGQEDKKGRPERTFKFNLDAKGIQDEQITIELDKLLAVREALLKGGDWGPAFREKLKFWFPEDQPNRWPSSKEDALQIIEFAIKQMHSLSSYRFGRFMAGHYPKDIETALKVFDPPPLEGKGYVLEKGGRRTTRQGVELDTFITTTNALPQTELIREFHYRFKKFDCPMIEDVNVRDALVGLYDELLIIASKEFLVKGDRSKRYLQVKDALFELNKMAALLKNNNQDHTQTEQLKESLKKVEHVCNIIKPSYFMARIFKKSMAIRSSLNKNTQALKKSIRKERPNYFLIREKIDDTDLFARMVRVEAKDPSQGKKPGGIYTMEGDDHQQRKFMIKRGGGVGETYAEYVSWKQFLKANGDQKDIHAAATHLVVERKEGGYDSVEDFAKHVFVASEYTDAYYSNDAHKIAGFEQRPIMAGTMHSDLCGMLIALNKEQKLGLEHVTAHGMRTLDKDLHTGNVRLVVDIKPIKDEYKHLKAMDLSAALKQQIKVFCQKDNQSPEDKKAHLKKLSAIIAELKSLGAEVYFHKIDHGFAYFHAKEAVNYDSSALLKTLENPITVNPLVEDKLAVRLVPTNHISEFTAHDNAKDLLLSDEACDNIMKFKMEEQLQQLEDALTSSFADLKKVASEYTPKNTKLDVKNEQAKAEMYILKAFYKHISGHSYPSRDTDTPSTIQEKIRTYLKDARTAQIAREDQYYLKNLKIMFEKGDPVEQEVQKTKNPKQYLLYQLLMGIQEPTKDTQLVDRRQV